MDGDHSVRKFLPVGVGYAATAGAHLDRPTQIWLSLYTSALTYIDEVPTRFPSEIPGVYLFNDRFMADKPQANVVLDALAAIIRRAPDMFQSIPSKLIMTSSLNFVTSNLLEYETTSMQVQSSFSTADETTHCARHRPDRERGRTLSHLLPHNDRPRRRLRLHGLHTRDPPHRLPPSDPRSHALHQRHQVRPPLLLVSGAPRTAHPTCSDVLSFYKEELAGECNNQIAVMAHRNRESHLHAFTALAARAVGHRDKIVQILCGSRKACDEFERFSAGYFGFHVSIERYRLADLDL